MYALKNLPLESYQENCLNHYAYIKINCGDDVIGTRRGHTLKNGMKLFLLVCCPISKCFDLSLMTGMHQ